MSHDLSMDDPLERVRSSLAGRYAVERVIGRGGMAAVFLARDLKHQRRVAIKVLHAELAHAIGPERFLREIEIVAGLAHPHILPLHDSGEADGLLYFVMPFVDGESLKEKIDREKQLPIGEALRIAREVADALAYAHERGVVHRDVKPANIMLEANHAIVTDFGVAFMADETASERLTTSGIFPGTPLYMSPEQASAERTIDGRSDIYSLGCVLYEMLCGDPPFHGFSRQVLLARKMLDPVPGLRVTRPAITDTLENVTLTALARTSADRFQTAEEFVQALDRATFEQQRSGAPGATPQTPAPRDSRSTADPDGWRIPGKLVAVGGLLMLAAIGFLTNAAYNVKMQVPAEFTPLRMDLPLVGARALLPGLVYAFAILAVFMAVKHGTRLLAYGLRRVPRIDQTFGGWQKRTSARWDRLGSKADAVTVAEIFFVGAILVAIPVLLRFSPLLSDLWTTGTAGLSEARRPLHRQFTLAMTLLIVSLAYLWHRVFLYVRSRRLPAGRVLVARWGGLAWILILVLVLTAPWRLLWNNERPRLLVDGERGYLLIERDGDLVVFNAERRVTQLYRDGTTPTVVRLNTSGYVFEEEEDFTRARSGR